MKNGMNKRIKDWIAWSTYGFNCESGMQYANRRGFVAGNNNILE